MTTSPISVDDDVVEISVADAATGWARDGVDAALVRRATLAALETIGASPEAVSISVRLSDDDEIAALNARFRGLEKPTNVLSWPALSLEGPAEIVAPEGGERMFMGDVALAYGVVAREAEAAGASVKDHATHLTVHGILHLFGFNHEIDEDAAAMEGFESRAMTSLGAPDPYAAPGDDRRGDAAIHDRGTHDARSPLAEETEA